MSVVFFQAEDGIRDIGVTGVQTCALPISPVAKDVSATGVEDTPSIPLILKATDPDAGDKVDTFEIADLPANGTLYLDAAMRSEERRVGKERRSRWSPYH